MQLYPLKLVTVVGESVIMPDIAEEGVKLGATGFSMTEVNGHGSRSARERKRLACSSPTNSSLVGSHFKDRPSLLAMIARCPSDADRWPISSSELGLRRVQIGRAHV